MVKITVSMNKIAQHVCANHGVSLEEIRSPSRRQNLVKARHELFYQLALRTKHSYPRLGWFLNRDHTTILMGLSRFCYKHGLPHPRTCSAIDPRVHSKFKYTAKPLEDNPQVNLQSQRFQRSWRRMPRRDKKILVFMHYLKGRTLRETAEQISAQVEGAPVSFYAVQRILRVLRNEGLLVDAESKRKKAVSERRLNKNLDRNHNEESQHRQNCIEASQKAFERLQAMHSKGVDYSGQEQRRKAVRDAMGPTRRWPRAVEPYNRHPELITDEGRYIPLWERDGNFQRQARDAAEDRLTDYQRKRERIAAQQASQVAAQ